MIEMNWLTALIGEPLNLGRGKIFPRPQLIVWWADQNWPIFVTWP